MKQIATFYRNSQTTINTSDYINIGYIREGKIAKITIKGIDGHKVYINEYLIYSTSGLKGQINYLDTYWVSIISKESDSIKLLCGKPLNEVSANNLKGIYLFITIPYEGCQVEIESDSSFYIQYGANLNRNKSYDISYIQKNYRLNRFAGYNTLSAFCDGRDLGNDDNIIELFNYDISDNSKSFGTNFILTINNRAFGANPTVILVNLKYDMYRNYKYISAINLFPTSNSSIDFGLLEENDTLHVLLINNGTSFTNNKISITYIGGELIPFTFNKYSKDTSSATIFKCKYTSDFPSASNVSSLTSDTFVGRCVFAKDINKPVWWNGTTWVDATGATV